MILLNVLRTETPEPPRFTENECLGSTNASAQYRVQWKEPSNIDSFDLDHYQLTVGNDTMNIDAKENTVTVSVKTGTRTQLSIIAIDRCGVESANSNTTITVDSSTCMEGLDPGITSRLTGSTCVLSSSATAGITVLVLLIVALNLIWSVIVIVLIVKCRKCAKGEISHSKKVFVSMDFRTSHIALLFITFFI